VSLNSYSRQHRSQAAPRSLADNAWGSLDSFCAKLRISPPPRIQDRSTRLPILSFAGSECPDSLVHSQVLGRQVLTLFASNARSGRSVKAYHGWKSGRWRRKAHLCAPNTAPVVTAALRRESLIRKSAPAAPPSNGLAAAALLAQTGHGMITHPPSTRRRESINPRPTWLSAHY